VTFRVGQQVVCVDDRFSDRADWRRAVQTFPRMCSVYTIRQVVEDGRLTGLCFREIVNQRALFGGMLLEPAFNSKNFRRVETSNIELFKRMLALTDPA
jgi:hypothetical protein